MADHRVHIGLVFDHSLNFYRDIVRGIGDYGATKVNWVFVPVAPDPRAIHSQRGLQCGGMIAHIFSQAMAKSIAKLSRPVVNVASLLSEVQLPRVAVDHEAVGKMAANHFLERGFRQFAFFGYVDHQFSIQRERGFRSMLEAAGYSIVSYHERRTQRVATALQTHSPALGKWLAGLETPVAIFASNDLQGFQITEACRDVGLRVPEDAGILSVDNDDLLCGLSRPPLSSIALPTRRIGFEAARLLDRLLSGRELSKKDFLIPPIGVITRRSSDILAIDDADVAAALRFIHERVHEPIQVSDVVKHVPVSRRILERRFRSLLGRSIGKEIVRAHVEAAKHLLASTELPMSAVAKRSGLSTSKHLSVAIRRDAGLTPTQYRRQYRDCGSTSLSSA